MAALANGVTGLDFGWIEVRRYLRSAVPTSEVDQKPTISKSFETYLLQLILILLMSFYARFADLSRMGLGTE